MYKKSKGKVCNMGTEMEMPKYKCFKEVWALKIEDLCVNIDNGKTMIIPEDSRYAPIEISEEYRLKHNPQIGGYYVVYKDGYKSFSPAKAFEEGYEKVSR